MGLKPVTVAQLNNYIGRVLKTDPLLGNVSVVGEISNLKFHSSGHVYFSLKDDSSKINCFLASSVLAGITCPLEEGMEIVASGYVSVYERGGYYSLSIRSIEANGIGQLAAMFEELKTKLRLEGMFDEDRKKPLPEFPENVAVVTSETGAAIRDIIRTIKNKNNYVNIYTYPVLVQGPAAAGEIAAAIDDLNKNYKNMDVIITGRGGGSMEELWAFNEEVVARSIAASEIPVISAVGHESDFTIADFVADVRAATPTAAAEMAVPDTDELKEYVDELGESLAADLKSSVEFRRNVLESFNPEAFSAGILNRIAFEQVNAERILEGMTEGLKSRVSSYSQRVKMLGELIETSNPKAILDRGYSVVTDESGSILKDVSKLKAGQIVNIEAARGSAKAEITKISKSNN